IRIGTPAITTRGLKEAEARKVAELIVETIQNHTDEAKLDEVRAAIHAITTRGLKEAEARKVAELIVETIQNHTDEAKLDEVRAAIHAITKAFPLHKKLAATEA
ncbi:MAG TPA: hypothetical protein VFW58_07950, partial [Trichococcus sp.]|nr:hypothetical protein [Trichococcus sp.]